MEKIKVENNLEEIKVKNNLEEMDIEEYKIFLRKNLKKIFTEYLSTIDKDFILGKTLEFNNVERCRYTDKLKLILDTFLKEKSILRGKHFYNKKNYELELELENFKNNTGKKTEKSAWDIIEEAEKKIFLEESKNYVGKESEKDIRKYLLKILEKEKKKIMRIEKVENIKENIKNYFNEILREKFV